MLRSNFFVFSVKKHILPILFYLFAVCLILFSSSNLVAAKNGILLWANSVVPALLPFFISAELLNYTDIVLILGRLFNKLMRPLFNVPGEGAYAFIMGIISGYPVGAKIVAKLKEDGKCTVEECERLIAFTNNSGPLFIIGTLGISFLGDTRSGFLLLATHVLACITVGICFKFWKRSKNGRQVVAPTKDNIGSRFKTCPHAKEHHQPTELSFSNLGEILSNAITKAVSTIVIIGGFVMLFSVIVSMLSSRSYYIYIFKYTLRYF